MQQPELPCRQQADASLARFFEHLGHQPPATGFRGPPRLSGRPAHVDLGASIGRLRTADPAAAIVRPIPPRLRYRLARRRLIDGCERLFNVACTAAVIGIGGYVIVPALVTFAGGAWR